MTGRSLEKRCYWMDVARAVAILSVTLNHAVNRTYSNYHNQMEEFLRISTSSTLLKTGITVFSHLGVPLFLMLSGALLLRKRFSGPAEVGRFYRHNLGRLVITMELWLAIMYWFRVAMDGSGFLWEQHSLAGHLLAMVRTMLLVNPLTMDSMWYMPMIVCVYTLIPLLAAAREKLGLRAFLLPCAIVFGSSMLIPSYNSFASCLTLGGGGGAVSWRLHSSYLFSLYLLYLLGGCWVAQGGLRRLSGPALRLGALGSFLLCCACQYYFYSSPEDVLVSYEFAGLLPCAVLLLECFRRDSHLLLRLRKPVTYLAEISFGVYFVHILIMELLHQKADLSGLCRPAQLLVLEGVSLFGSVALIAVGCRVPVLRKYLFSVRTAQPRSEMPARQGG